MPWYVIAGVVALLAGNVGVVGLWTWAFLKTRTAAIAAEEACERLNRTIGGMRGQLAGLNGELRLAGLDDTEPYNPTHDYTN